jgi:hypothetical protein
MTAPFLRHRLPMLKNVFTFLLLLTAAAAGLAQVSTPAGVPPSPEPAAAQPAMPYALSQKLVDLEQVTQSTVRNLDNVRVDKWKTEGRYKDQAKDNVQSLQRNLNAALPTLVQQVRTNPASLAGMVKLYRNLNAVYDVLATFAENTGAFGSKDDYRMLSTDVANFESVRRSIADQLEQMASSQDEQIARLKAQAKAQAATPSPAAYPKRVIVDDTAPAKKSVTKKKPAAPTPTPQ